MHRYVKRRWMLPFFSYILPNFIPAFLFQINVLNGKVQYKSWLIFQSSQYKLFVAPKFLVQLYHKLATKRLHFGGKVNLLVCDISRNINDEIGKFTKNNNKCYFCHEQFQKLELWYMSKHAKRLSEYKPKSAKLLQQNCLWQFW